MGEANRRGTKGGLYGPLAPLAFIKAWFAAESHQEIVFTDRQMGSGEWVVLAEIGDFAALLPPEQCRGVAAKFEEHVHTLDSGTDAAQAVSDLIVAIRAAADECERLHPGL